MIQPRPFLQKFLLPAAIVAGSQIKLLNSVGTVSATGKRLDQFLQIPIDLNIVLENLAQAFSVVLDIVYLILH